MEVSMTNEEKKAIETIKDLKEIKWYEHAFDNGTEILSEEEKQDIEDKSWCNKVTGELKHDILIRETILNLLKKQDNRIKELESDKKIKDKMIEMYIEHIYRSCDFDNRIKTKEQIKQYFENLAKESE